MEGIEERIRVRAYEIWMAEGRPHGQDEDHWIRAAAEIGTKPAAEAKPKAPRKRAAPKDKPALAAE